MSQLLLNIWTNQKHDAEIYAEIHQSDVVVTDQFLPSDPKKLEPLLHQWQQLHYIFFQNQKLCMVDRAIYFFIGFWWHTDTTSLYVASPLFPRKQASSNIPAFPSGFKFIFICIDFAKLRGAFHVLTHKCLRNVQHKFVKQRKKVLKGIGY